MTNCLFCQIAECLIPVEGCPENVILCESENFYVKPALGHFIEGYCLVISKEHVRTMAELPVAVAAELEIVLDEVGRRLNVLYPHGRCIFEHGSTCPANRAGSCIDHAHMHILPVNCDVRNKLAPMAFDRVSRVRELNGSVGSATDLKSYLYYEPKPGLGTVYSCQERLPSQFMRRLISQQLGIDNDWDWRASPYSEKILQFLAKWNAEFHAGNGTTAGLLEVTSAPPVP